MIVRAMIKNKVSDSEYRITIPQFENLSKNVSGLDGSYVAVLSMPFTATLQLNVGDTVFVDFENNSHINPVIIGFISTSDGSINTSDFFDFESHNTIFPTNTSIGNATKDDIINILGLKSNVQNQIDSINDNIDTDNSHIDDTQRDINTLHNLLETANSYYNEGTNKLTTLLELVGKSDSGIENRINIVSENIGKSMAVVPKENRTVASIIDELNNKIDRILKYSPR